MAATCGAGTFRSTPKTGCRQGLHVLRLPALSFSPPSCSLNSIKQSHFLMVRYVSALVNVRMVTANSQRNHGRNGGECEDDGQCCDEGLHGWSPLEVTEIGFSNNVTLRRPLPRWVSPLVARVSDKPSIARIEQIINNRMMASGEKCRVSGYAGTNRREHL